MNGKNYNVVIFKVADIIQLDGVKAIVKYNVQDVMFLNMENSMYLEID